MQQVSGALVDRTCVLLATYGLENWRPDVLSDPDSHYNQAHQLVHLKTFQHALLGNFYAKHRPDVDIIKNNLALATRMYVNYVFKRQRELAKLELKTPGEVAKRAEDTNAYRRRKEVMSSILQYGFPF